MAQLNDIQDVIHNTVTEMIQQVSVLMTQIITDQIKTEFASQLESARPVNGRSEPARRGRQAGPTESKPPRPRPGDVSRWVADKQARRVPNFVIEMTGLKTKKEIVAKFGEDAEFEKGRPLPTALRGGAGKV